MPEIEIQGITCKYRGVREDEDILYVDLPQEEQYFKRADIPFTEDEVNDLLTVEYELRKSKYTKWQAAWVEREEKRMTYGEGVYAMINGSLTYIPASYWGYINYWILEHGENADYREADRIFFLFLEYIYFETDVLGITRGKGRRQGASSLGYYLTWWTCGREEKKIGGSISYNDPIAKKNFSMMFLQGLASLPPCFSRDISNKSETSVKFETVAKDSIKGVRKKKGGLGSFVDTLPNSVNSYDGGRATFLQIDESGKYEKIDINTYWSKVSPTLKVGRNKVGMAYLPTTVNPMDKGGEEYEKFWKAADQNATNPKTGKPYGLNTPHKVIRYFVPATEGYAGCIDKFGNSIVDDPAVPIMGNDGQLVSQGSRTTILLERELKKLLEDGITQYLEHRRDFPLDLYDMFAFTTGTCEFNEENFIKQIEWIENHPGDCYWRQIRLYEEWVDSRDKGEINITKKRVVKWADDTNGNVWMYERPNVENLFTETPSRITPQNTHSYIAGADTYKNIFALEGSDGVIYIFKKSCIIEGKETGLYPVCKFVGRPKLIKQFNYQAFLMCLLYGCRINFEIDAGTWFYEDFAEWNALGLLEWEPARDPLRKDRIIKPGTESAQPFQLAKQLDVAKLYFDGNGIDFFNGNVNRVRDKELLKQGLKYNHSERTPYHLIVGFMMALLPCLSSPAPQRPTSRLEKPLITPRKVVLPR